MFEVYTKGNKIGCNPAIKCANRGFEAYLFSEKTSMCHKYRYVKIICTECLENMYMLLVF